MQAFIEGNKSKRQKQTVKKLKVVASEDWGSWQRKGQGLMAFLGSLRSIIWLFRL